MINKRKFITAVIGVWVFTAAVYADMVSGSHSDSGCKQSAHFSGQTGLEYKNLFSPSGFPSVTALNLGPVDFLAEANADVTQIYEIQHPQSLANGPSSFNLCMSALLGLGLCSSAHWVKRLSIGFVPEWYHNGGPFQIGHSYAVTPESLCPAAAYCFIQPVFTVEDSLPQYRLRAVTYLWRKSQFTPVILAPRGPPDMS